MQLSALISIIILVESEASLRGYSLVTRIKENLQTILKQELPSSLNFSVSTILHLHSTFQELPHPLYNNLNKASDHNSLSIKSLLFCQKIYRRLLEDVCLFQTIRLTKTPSRSISAEEFHSF